MKSRSLDDITDAELNQKEAAALAKLARVADYVAEKYPNPKGRALVAACRDAAKDPSTFWNWWIGTEYAALAQQNPLLELAFMAHDLAGTASATQVARSVKAQMVAENTPALPGPDSRVEG